MEKYIITGGNQLRGEVEISGAKNAAVAIIPATVLAGGKCVIENVPNISDVTLLLKMLQKMGASVQLIDKKTIEIDTRNIHDPTVPYELARYMRASYYFLGALLGRCHQASVSMPGGCHFGVRPIDQHIKGFEAMGANVSIDRGMINAEANTLSGAPIYFDVISVGATINVMLAAVKAKGLTMLENAAREPHIVDLANFLNSMGADIMGAGTDIIKIRGVSSLRGGSYSIIPDQIEAGTYMAAVAAAGGSVLVKNVIPKHLDCITAKLMELGCDIEEQDEAVRVTRQGPINRINLKTLPYPGFPTDMQPQLAVVLCMAEGTSVVTEGVWDTRYRYVDELRRMGAKIQVDGKLAIIEGVDSLSGAPVAACDLRAGAAMVIAGLAAQGVTEVENIVYIERGYENLADKLKKVGADIARVVMPEPEAKSKAN